MKSRTALAAILLCLVAPRRGVTAVQPAGPIELDVVVLDDHDNAVPGLQEGDFVVKEDGKTVAIDEVDEIGGGGQPAPRTVALILDDSGVPPTLTNRVQQIAQRFMMRIAPGDRVDVVRLNHRTDEANGDRAAAEERIDQFRAGMTPFFGRETIETALTKIATLSRQFARIEHRRKAIVAIGAPGTFDVSEPANHDGSLIWDYWVNAVTAASRANTSVYVVDPAGLTPRLKLERSVGIVEKTGGDWFYNSSDFDRAAARVWNDAGHYYLVAYTPRGGARQLHDIQVAVARPGAHVLARKMRG